MIKKLVITSWITIFVLLFLYSFTQVDLGLTFSRAGIFQATEKYFQYIGYFNRPLSTFLFSALVIVLTGLYGFTLWLVWEKKLALRSVWIITILASSILLFSYNAFSYDLFNYIFDAKIFTYYGSNPYLQKALDYPGDPMLGFMRWTHRTYPYGPSWIGISIFLSYLGFGYFAVTFYLFKAFMAASFLLSAFFVVRLARVTKLIEEERALAFFALNPLVIIEILVSGHHDLVMMGLALGSIFFLFKSKKIYSGALLLNSIGIKFATVFLLPLFLWYSFSKKKSKQHLFLCCSLLLMIVPVVLASQRTSFQPWYLLFVFPFTAFFIKKYYVFIPAFVITCLALLQYVPYLYLGNYDEPVPDVMNQTLWMSIVIALVMTAIYKIYITVRK